MHNHLQDVFISEWVNCLSKPFTSAVFYICLKYYVSSKGVLRSLLIYMLRLCLLEFPVILKSKKYLKKKGRVRHIPDSRLNLLLQLMKATVLAESSYFINFHQALSAPAMSTDMNQLVSHSSLIFKIFLIILPFQVFLLYQVQER